MKWLAVPRLAVCLAVVLGVTTGCESDNNRGLSDPKGSGILTGLWVAVKSDDPDDSHVRWSISHEGSSVTIDQDIGGPSSIMTRYTKYSATYDETSRLLTMTESLAKYELSADNNTLTAKSSLYKMVRQ